MSGVKIQFGGKINRTSLTEIVEHGMKKERESDRQGRLYASESGLCSRQGALSATQDGNSKLSSAFEAYVRLGTEIEEIVTDSLYAQGILVYKQLRLPDIGINMGGYIDAIVFHQNKLRILEIKSCGDLPTSPKDSHKAQAIIYSVVTGIPASLFYFSRKVANFSGKMQMVEFNMEMFDEDVQRHHLQQAIYGSLCVQNGLLPNIPLHMTKKSLCGLCSFKPICFEGRSYDGNLTPINNRDELRLTKDSFNLADDLLSPKKTAQRRNGLLKHISETGNDFAKELLVNTDWKNL